jgi:hypothetical protein
VGRRCKANDVVAVLEELTSLYPAPAFVCSDNGPDFIAHALKCWNENSGTTMAYIEPGSPWQRGFAELQIAGSGMNSWLCVCSGLIRCLTSPLTASQERRIGYVLKLPGVLMTGVVASFVNPDVSGTKEVS